MASGNYKNQPTESPPHISPNITIPKRATRDMRAASSAATREPQTRVEEPTKSQRVRAPKASTALKEPDFEDLLPPYPIEEPHPLRHHRPWLSLLLLTLSCVVIGAIVLTMA